MGLSHHPIATHDVNLHSRGCSYQTLRAKAAVDDHYDDQIKTILAVLGWSFKLQANDFVGPNHDFIPFDSASVLFDMIIAEYMVR